MNPKVLESKVPLIKMKILQEDPDTTQITNQHSPNCLTIPPVPGAE